MIPLSLGLTQGRSPAISAGQDVNVFPVINREDAKSPVTLSERPGLKRLVCPVAGEVRCMLKRGRTLYALVGGGFYEINLDTLAYSLIFTMSTTTGKAWIEKNANSQILVVASNEGWVFNWTTNLFGVIADVDFPGAISLAFTQQYAVTVDPDSGRLRNCELNNFELWDGTAFVSAESAPDNLLSIIADHKEIVAFGEATAEIYRSTSDVDAVFQPLEGGFMEIGINAPASVAKVSSVVLFLDNSLQVRMMEAYSPRIISNDALMFKICQMAKTDDAVGMAYTWRGHSFYLLTFPTANKTFAYDLTSSGLAGRDIWHEVRSYPVAGENRWRGQCVLQDGVNVYVGDYENGWIYTLDEATHTDNLEPLQRIWTCSEIVDSQQRRTMYHNELELEVEMGVATDAVEDPQVALTYSDDNGRTWSSELWNSLGRVGEYKNRARWFGLGSSKCRLYRFMVSDDVKLEVVGVYLRAEMGDW